MATYFIGINNGDGLNGNFIVEQATTTGKDIEIAINTTANVPSKEELLLGVQKLTDYIAVKNKGW